MAGQPGIGKSTLLAQVAAFIARQKQVLYVSGEESVSQVKLRAERLGAVDSENLQLASSNSAEDIAASIQTGQYNLVIVDSIQTLSLAEISSAPGSVSQITNSSNVIIRDHISQYFQSPLRQANSCLDFGHLPRARVTSYHTGHLYDSS